MAFPTITNAVSTESGADTTSWDWTLPSGNAAGKQLYLIIYSDGITQTVASGLSDFTPLGSQAGTQCTCLVYGKITDGSESSGTITMNVSERGVVHSILASGAHASTLGEVVFNTGSTSSATFAALNPSAWGTEDTKWLAAVGISDSNEESNVWTPPSSYTLVQAQDSGGTSNDTQTAVWTRDNAVASETPGSMTFDLGSTAFVTATIGIRPAGAPATYTASAAVSVAPATASASGTVDNPGVSAVTVGAATAAASGTVDNPDVFSATAAVTVGEATASGSATHEPLFTAAAAVSINGADCAGSATSADPVYAGAAAVTVGEAVCNAAANTEPVFTAIGAVVTGAATCAGVATFTAEVPNPEVVIRDAFFTELSRYRGGSSVGWDGRFAIERSGGAIVTPTAFAPAAATHRGGYYYDVSVNALYRKVVTARGPGYVVAHWQRISE